MRSRINFAVSEDCGEKSLVRNHFSFTSAISITFIADGIQDEGLKLVHVSPARGIFLETSFAVLVLTPGILPSAQQLNSTWGQYSLCATGPLKKKSSMVI
ncbi:hypothetical protein ElyMa_001985600 [Elysia marginata]|uniref:Uncharacterized protein n=1 Tax=Elysia marginata TaxID=1093978 RepID=A0AAV4F206_9GAST|nr:hypothetical protein ElyMa_001985600 [Elysia marginata]